MISIRLNQKGFSLIEILIVLGLITLLVATVASKITKSSDRELRRDIRHFAANMKDLRNKGRMRNTTYRLVINLPENPKEKQTYWVESTSKKFLVTYDEEELKKQKESLPKDAPDPSGFAIDKEFFGGEPKTLPEGLFFSSIELASSQKEFTAGRLYIHFFPEGRVEECAIHITNRLKLFWTLAVHPLTGRVDIITKEVKLKNLTP